MKSNNVEDQDFIQKFVDTIQNEVKIIKDCSEKSIVDTYIKQYDLCDKENFSWESLQEVSRKSLVKQYTNVESDNLIDIYFNDVKKEYIQHPMKEQDELDFLPENREIFLKNNLKLVIDVAKRYRNLGVPFEDLIQEGNEGLCAAFDKFDTNRANLRNNIIKDINNLSEEPITFETAKKILTDNYTYNKQLPQVINNVPENGFQTKDDFIQWAKENVKTAVFASVAFQWIRAFIIGSINGNKIIKIPKSKNNEKASELKLVYLDQVNNYTEDCYHDNQISEIANENFVIEDEYTDNINKKQAQQDVIEQILNVLDSTEKRIIKKRFGIGFPYQLNPFEISENEKINLNKVKYIITQSIKKIQENLTDKNRELIKELLFD